MSMNHWGQLAMQHRQTHWPTEYAQIEDPVRYFTDLGEQIAAEIERRRNQAEMLSGAGQSTDFLANLGSLNTVSMTVEDAVMREMAFTEPETAS